jgi:hypothetical protein
MILNYNVINSFCQISYFHQNPNFLRANIKMPAHPDRNFNPLKAFNLKIRFKIPSPIKLILAMVWQYFTKTASYPKGLLKTESYNIFSIHSFNYISLLLTSIDTNTHLVYKII